MAENQCSKISHSPFVCGQGRVFLRNNKNRHSVYHQPVARFQTDWTALSKNCFQSFRDLPPFCFHRLFSRTLHILSSHPVFLSHRPTGGNYRGQNEENVRRFKAACQSVFCTESAPEAFSLCVSLTVPVEKRDVLRISLRNLGTARLNMCRISCKGTSEIKGE